MDAHEQALRAQYAAARLPMLGITFEAAMASKNISLALECGVRAAAVASRNNPQHWSEPPDRSH